MVINHLLTGMILQETQVLWLNLHTLNSFGRSDLSYSTPTNVVVTPDRMDGSRVNWYSYHKMGPYQLEVGHHNSTDFGVK